MSSEIRPGSYTRTETTSVSALVVDDDQLTLKVVHAMLKALGFQTVSALGGNAAMRCLKAATFDLVITDFQMPDMDGNMLAFWLKQQSSRTRVIIMTGLNRSDVEELMAVSLADKWIFKPFNLRELKTQLVELVG